MRKILSMIALSLGLSVAATSANALVTYGQDLRHVGETTLPNPSGTGTVSLCHLVDYADFVFVPVYTSLLSYALSNDGCTGNIYRTLTVENFQLMQTSGLVDADLPAEPAVSTPALVWGHAWLIVAALAILFRVFGAVTGRSGRKAKTPDALAVHALVAMSQVAIADGRLDDAEVNQIAQILTRLTGNSYGPARVMEMLQRLNPSAADLAQVGQDLSSKDRQIVLEAALHIAVADGEIHENEYAVVSDLAQRMRIGSDQFRNAMTRITAHIQTVQPV